jgi:drug/metabolite transporter (DMT)-like permease
MPHDRLLRAAAVAILVISVGLIIAGATLDYVDGPGAGTSIYQFGRLLLIGGGAVAIWYFKWSRGSERGEDTAVRKLPKMTIGMYAFWIVVAALLVVALHLQQQGRFFTEDDRLWSLILAVSPVVLAAIIIAYFLVRDVARGQLNKKGAPRRKAGPRLPKQ